MVLLERLFGNPGYVFGLIGLCFVVWFMMYSISGLILKFKAKGKHVTQFN